jgi:UDP-N-acetylmuramate dehydrogenase
VSLASFVQWTLAQGYCGLENLSLIPGTVGAAPMQNVGAYGVEIKDVFAGLTALDRETGELRDFSLAECAFGYRDSLFKRNPGRWLILRVRFALTAPAGPSGLRPGASAPDGAGRRPADCAGDQ